MTFKSDGGGLKRLALWRLQPHGMHRAAALLCRSGQVQFWWPSQAAQLNSRHRMSSCRGGLRHYAALRVLAAAALRCWLGQLAAPPLHAHSAHKWLTSRQWAHQQAVAVLLPR